MGKKNRKTGRRQTRTRADAGGREHGFDPVAAVVANVFAVAGLVLAGYLVKSNPDLYYAAAQEDGALEWASFLAFFAAAPLFVVAGMRQRRVDGGIPWFLCGVGLFCFVVAMEEISWGQRLLAYRPPVYFLEHNYQQELNFHNVVDGSWRRLALLVVLLGYGVVFPLLAWSRVLRALISRLSLVAPPVALVPAFLIAFLTYIEYPWQFTGEWVELSMGYAFLFVAIRHATQWAEETGSAARQRLAALAAGFLVILGGVMLAVGTASVRGGTPERVAMAQSETAALAEDLKRLGSACPGSYNLSKRVFTYVKQKRVDALFKGSFAAQAAKDGVTERAQYFLDPWNAPYWVRCGDRNGLQVLMVYSFGPNARRDSSEWDLAGDDIGRTFTLNP